MPDYLKCQPDGTSAGDLAVALSIDEASDTGFFWLNGNYNQVSSSDTFSSAYDTPSANDAEDPLQIGATGAAISAVANTTRFYAAAIWSRALDKAELDAIHAIIGPRLGL